MIRALFYRGRHHVRTARRGPDGGLVTVRTVIARLRREALGSVSIEIVPDVHAFAEPIRRALLARHESQEVFA